MFHARAPATASARWTRNDPVARPPRAAATELRKGAGTGTAYEKWRKAREKRRRTRRADHFPALYSGGVQSADGWASIRGRM